jgi:hypothetical protein
MPSVVLWLMAAVVVGGSGLLVFASSPTPPTTLAAASKPLLATSANPSHVNSTRPAPGPAPALSTLQVP